MKKIKNFYGFLITLYWLKLTCSNHLYYDFKRSRYARDYNTQIEYVLDYSYRTYTGSITACNALHSGKIVKLNTTNELKLIVGAHKLDSSKGFLFIGVKMAPYSDDKYNLTYDDGSPFNITQFSLSIIIDYLPNGQSTTFNSPTRTAYIYHYVNSIRGHTDVGTRYGVVCTRNFSETYDPNVLNVFVNKSITSTILYPQLKAYKVSLIECLAICTRTHIQTGSCYGIRYDNNMNLCAIVNNSQTIASPSVYQAVFTEQYDIYLTNL